MTDQEIEHLEALAEIDSAIFEIFEFYKQHNSLADGLTAFLASSDTFLFKLSKRITQVCDDSFFAKLDQAEDREKFQDIMKLIKDGAETGKLIRSMKQPKKEYLTRAKKMGVQTVEQVDLSIENKVVEKITIEQIPIEDDPQDKRTYIDRAADRDRKLDK